MQEKFEFNTLPNELQIEAAQNLSNTNLISLALTSRNHLALFKPLIDARKLLHFATRGDHETVRTMLKKDISLIFTRGKVTDCSGRAFDNVSAFEYALWALDKDMWTTMLDSIPDNEEGNKVLAALVAQYSTASTKGVTYKLNGETITEKHFDFENSIIKRLKAQVDSMNEPDTINWDAIDKQWREGVGGAQKLLPMHVVYEYCSSKPFYPLPTFKLQPNYSKKFYNWNTKKDENWFSEHSKLAIDFAIYKGHSGKPQPLRAPRRASLVAVDLAAMTALYEARKQDFATLKSQLEQQPTLDSDHQVCSDVI